MKFPIAENKEKILEKHDDKRIDNYYWLNEKDNKSVLEYLENENDYNDKLTSHTKDFQKDLFEEMKSRIKEDDQSVPYKYNGYWYITRYEKGKDYPIYSRKKDSLTATEEVLFDCNVMAFIAFNSEKFQKVPPALFAVFSIATNLENGV